MHAFLVLAVPLFLRDFGVSNAMPGDFCVEGQPGIESLTLEEGSGDGGER